MAWPLPRPPDQAASVAAFGALVLALLKGALFLSTGSMVVAVSAWDSIMDFVVSMVNRKTLLFARSQPDENHPYGHGKAESIASLGQGALLVGGAVTIIGASVEMTYRYLKSNEAVVESSWLAVFFFLFAALASLAITYWLQYHGKMHNSPALKADAEHYRGDVFANLGSAVGLTAVALTELAWLDPIIASLFAFKIGESGYKLLKQSVNELMDHDIDHTLKDRVELFLNSWCQKS